MEELQLKLSAKEINAKKFQGKDGGYDALQVDKYLDLVVNDYIAFEQFASSMKKIINSFNELKSNSIEYQEKLSELEQQNNLLKEELNVIKQNEGAVQSNIELLQRISLLEQALYNLGKDPSKIK